MSSTRVGALLLEADLISPDQLERALEHQQHRGGKTVGILVELGMVEQDQVYRFLARRGVPAFNPTHCAVQSHVTDLLPRDFVLRHEMIPVDRLGRLLTVAMVYPFDVDAITQAERITGLRVKPVLCRAKEFHETARRLYPEDDERCGALSSEHFAPAGYLHRNSAQLARHTIERIRDLHQAPVAKHTKARFSFLRDAHALNAERAAAVLSRDPIGLARVLSVANAREWTRQRPIVDLHEAIRRLGISAVVEALEPLAAFEEKLKDVERVFTQWRGTAVAVAETAVSIARNYAFVGAPGIYEAALLHNLGALALLLLDPASYPEVYMTRPVEKRHSREIELFGLTDCEAGAALASAWGLPDSIVITIRHLFNPGSAPSSHDTVAVAALAHHIVQMERNLETDCAEALRILGLTQTTLRTTMLRLHAASHASGVEI